MLLLCCYYVLLHVNECLQSYGRDVGLRQAEGHWKSMAARRPYHY